MFVKSFYEVLCNISNLNCYFFGVQQLQLQQRHKKRSFKDQKSLDELTSWYKLKKQAKQRQYMITGGLCVCDSDGLK